VSERTSADPAAPGGPEQPPEATQGVEAAGTPRADVVPVHGAVTAPTVASSAGSRDGGHGVVARPGVDLAVPLYAHPSTHPELWHASARAARHIRFAVVNVHNGVGVDLDLAYPPMIDLLRTARVRLVGYVDTAYGNRPQPDVVAEIEAWVARYGLRGVFFDQVRGDFAGLQYYSECALAARAAGAQFVVVNPGTDCDPAYAEVANVTVTFEGTWHAYLEYRPPAWVSTRPPSRFCHLVYDVPDAAFADAPQAVQARHAVTAFFSSGSGGNPWDRLDAALVDAWALNDTRKLTPKRR